MGFLRDLRDRWSRSSPSRPLTGLSADPDEERVLRRRHIRLPPLPPPLQPRQRRLTDVSSADITEVKSRQQQSSLVHRLPKEVRLLIYSHIFCHTNLLIEFGLYSNRTRHLRHTVVSPLDTSEQWKEWRPNSEFWPEKLRTNCKTSTTYILPLLLTCRAMWVLTFIAPCLNLAC